VLLTTESAAAGTLACFILAGAYHRLRWTVVRKAIEGTLRVTVMMFMILAGSTAFSQILAYTGASTGLVEMAANLPVQPILVIIVMQIILFMLGTFMEPLSIMMLTIPIYFPIIQALENARIGRAAHPRSGDLSYPIFRKEGCTQCKRCTVECPFGAIDEDEKRFPVFNESRCRRCGTCMGACPVRVISFENYSVDSVGQQLKNVDMPDEFDEKPRILVLACENDAYPALDMAAQQGNNSYSQWARVIPVRCLGSVNTIWVTDALNSGYDGIVLMGCQKGDNYQCHFVKGSEMANVRMSKVDDTLETLNLEKERVETYEVAITDIERAPRLINDMAEAVEKMGMSPFKF